MWCSLLLCQILAKSWLMKLGILQGLVDLKKPPEMISGNMTTGKKKIVYLKKSCFIISIICYITWLGSKHKFHIGCSNVYLFRIVHEVCVDGTATQLFTFGMPCFKWDCTALSPFPLGKVSGVSICICWFFGITWLQLDIAFVAD